MTEEIRGPKQPKRLQSVGYWAILLGGLIDKATHRAFIPFQVTPTEFLILHMCFLGVANTVTEMALVSPLEVSAMSRQVERLRTRGLLERRRSQEDRRVVFLELTEPGRLLLLRLYRVATKVEEKIVQNMSSEERDYLLKTLQELTIDLEYSGRLFED